MSDLDEVFKEDECVRRWRAESENASARLELAKMRKASALLLSQHEPVSPLGMNRDHLRVLLGYLQHHDESRLKRDVAALAVPVIDQHEEELATSLSRAQGELAACRATIARCDAAFAVLKADARWGAPFTPEYVQAVINDPANRSRADCPAVATPSAESMRYRSALMTLRSAIRGRRFTVTAQYVESIIDPVLDHADK